MANIQDSQSWLMDESILHLLASRHSLGDLGELQNGNDDEGDLNREQGMLSHVVQHHPSPHPQQQHQGQQHQGQQHQQQQQQQAFHDGAKTATAKMDANAFAGSMPTELSLTATHDVFAGTFQQNKLQPPLVDYTVPPTPNSAGVYNFSPSGHQGQPQKGTDDMFFTPLMSPMMTNFDNSFSMSDYVHTADAFSPLTSPAIEAMYTPGKTTQPQEQHSHFGELPSPSYPTLAENLNIDSFGHGESSHNQQQPLNHTSDAYISPDVYAFSSSVSNPTVSASTSRRASVSKRSSNGDSIQDSKSIRSSRRTRDSSEWCPPQKQKRHQSHIKTSSSAIPSLNLVASTGPEETAASGRSNGVHSVTCSPNDLTGASTTSPAPPDQLMPPPALPRSRQKVSSYLSQDPANTQTTAAAMAATPSTFLKLADRRFSPRMNSNSNPGNPHANQQQPCGHSFAQLASPGFSGGDNSSVNNTAFGEVMEDISLPEAAATGSTMQPPTTIVSPAPSESVNDPASSSPEAKANRGSGYSTSGLSPMTLSPSIYPVQGGDNASSPSVRHGSHSTSASSSVVAVSSSVPESTPTASTTPIIAPTSTPSTRSTPPNTQVKRAESSSNLRLSSSTISKRRPSGRSSTQPSPALRPKVSPSIKPLLSSGQGNDNGGDDSALYDLTSKSNYQHIVDGTLPSGVSYPQHLAKELSSRRTNHKVAEQGRRNRINAAVKEIEALIPEGFALSHQDTGVEGKPQNNADGSSGGDMASPAATGSGVTNGGGAPATMAQNKANSQASSSKAGSIELAVTYIKSLQKELRETKEKLEKSESPQANKSDTLPSPPVP